MLGYLHSSDFEETKSQIVSQKGTKLVNPTWFMKKPDMLIDNVHEFNPIATPAFALKVLNILSLSNNACHIY